MLDPNRPLPTRIVRAIIRQRIIRDPVVLTVVVSDTGTGAAPRKLQRQPTPAHIPPVMLPRTPAPRDVRGIPGPRGLQGGPGPQGLPGTSGGAVFTALASESLGGHRVVRSTGADSCGYLDITDSSQPDDLLGLTLTAGAIGEEVTLQLRGSVTEPSWTWVPGLPLFVTLNSMLTQTPPDGTLGEAASLLMGVARSATTIFLSPQHPVYF